MSVQRDGRGRRWSREENAEIVRMYDGGATATQIAAHFGVTRQCIQSKLKAWRLPAQHRKPRMDELAELMSRGFTLSQAAVRMGVSYNNAKNSWQRIRAGLGPQAV